MEPLLVRLRRTILQNMFNLLGSRSWFRHVLSSQQQELSSKVFAHMCDVVDDNEQYYEEKIHQISKLIILEGKTFQSYLW